MNEELLTISLLIIVVCNLGVLYLYFRVFTGQDAICSQLHLVLDRLSQAAIRQRGMKHALLSDGKLTRQRIAQAKTRLADEERDDQRRKAAARRKGVQS